MASYSSDQAVIQRYMTTDTQRNAANAVLTNGLMAIPASMLFFAVGTALFVFFKINPDELDPTFKSDAVFPLFISTQMPPVVVVGGRRSFRCGPIRFINKHELAFHHIGNRFCKTLENLQR